MSWLKLVLKQMVPFNTTILSQKIINKILFQTKISVQKQILVHKVFDKKKLSKKFPG